MSQIVVIVFIALGDGEVGHQGAVVDAVELDLVADLLGRRQHLGDVGEELVHLAPRLHPLLLAVAHALGVIEVLARAETDEAVVRLGVLLVEEMDIVGRDDLHPVLLS